MGDLNNKRLAFAKEYLTNGRNGSEAYRAVYKPDADAHHASVQAAKIMRTAAFKRLVAEANVVRSREIAKVEAKVHVNKETICAELARLGFASMRSFVRVATDGTPRIDLSNLTDDDWAAIKSVKTRSFLQGRGEDAELVTETHITLHDKRQPLMDIANLLGYAQANPLDDLSRLTREELIALAAERLTRLFGKSIEGRIAGAEPAPGGGGDPG